MLVFNSHRAPVGFGASNDANRYQSIGFFSRKALNLARLVRRQFYSITGVRVN